MTLREIFPEWWCKVTFSIPEICSGNYNFLDFSIYEFIFSIVILLFIKWIIHFIIFVLGLIIPERTLDATIISPSILEKEINITNDEIKDIKGKDLEFEEDIFSLEEEENKKTTTEDYIVENLDKEIEKSIVNISGELVKKK